ncbi:MAG: MarR family winged helix-turn-helix transcriptional regulator [Aliishimia sp.]
MSIQKPTFDDVDDFPHHLRTPPPGASQVHMLASRLKRMFDADINDILNERCSLSLPEWRILSALSDSSEPVCQKEVVERIGFAQGQTSRALEVLEAGDMIVSRQSTSDRRSRYYKITSIGLAQVKSLLPHMEDRRSALESVLSEAEIANFEQASVKLIGILNDRQKR